MEKHGLSSEQVQWQMNREQNDYYLLWKEGESQC